ncbi:SRPBCC domain-containing protein [Flavobacterium sp. MK4S-17]|uniref:SRPBCC domain-containing protein n=1 Tax=Flavobacterium sp. MK4S-17 TaxID=2543737 RepID=UPI001357C240|nr:SRPBCC domain-containing protein [Flavobacterium sp. MK4S-17]
MEIKTAIEINASVGLVWDTLMNFHGYADWNPFIKDISGLPDVGGILKVTIQPPNKKQMTFTPVVISNNIEKEFRWKGKLLIKGIFDGEHYFELQGVNEGKTIFIHGEIFRGLLVPLFGGMLSETKKGFEMMNHALKIECERKATN